MLLDFDLQWIQIVLFLSDKLNFYLFYGWFLPGKQESNLRSITFLSCKVKHAIHEYEWIDTKCICNTRQTFLNEVVGWERMWARSASRDNHWLLWMPTRPREPESAFWHADSKQWSTLQSFLEMINYYYQLNSDMHNMSTPFDQSLSNDVFRIDALNVSNSVTGVAICLYLVCC